MSDRVNESWTKYPAKSAKQFCIALALCLFLNPVSVAYWRSEPPSHCLLTAASGLCQCVRFLPPHVPVPPQCRSSQQASCAQEKVRHPSATLANLQNVRCRRLSGSRELSAQGALVYDGFYWSRPSFQFQLLKCL